MPTYRSRKALRWILLLAYGLTLFALAWHYRREASAERAHAYAIAAGMERLLSLLGPSAAGGTLAALRERADVIALEEFPKEVRALLREGQRGFTVVFSANSPRRTDLGRYFADIALGNYYFAVIDEKGALVDFFWDKP